MKINKYIASCLLLLFSMCFSVNAESIEKYDINIKINQDASISVTESMLYDFGEESRHGIYRTLPYAYVNDWGHFKLKYENIKVVNEKGEDYNYDLQMKDFDSYEVKIGDPDIFVTGKMHYIMSYDVKRGMNYFEDHDELYWNAIGTENNIEINNITLAVESNNIIESNCYYGEYGSNNECEFSNKDNSVIAKIDKLEPGQGLTFAVGIKKGTIYEPTETERLMMFIEDNWYFPIPFLILLFFFYRWHKYGRDPEKTNVIVANYTQIKGISPIESKTIMTEGVDMSKIGAELIDLAIKGYIKIEKEEKEGFFSKEDYTIQKIRDFDDKLTPFQLKLIKALLNKKESISIKAINKDQTSNYFTNLRMFLTTNGPKMIYERLTEENYFPKNPEHVRTINIIFGILMFLPMFIVPLILEFFLSAMIGLVLMIGVIIFSSLMPKKTIKGVESKNYLEGLKKYISIAEIERIKFHNSPKKSIEHFEELLPYAIVFGLEKEWASKFKLDDYSPNWYTGPHGAILSSAVIASDLSNIGNSISMSVASSGASGLGGSGGVGGGGGGGSVGSW